MHLKKKNEGYILLEVLLLLGIISLLIVLNSKIIVQNISKVKLYEIEDDILTLSIDESALIDEANININNNEELCAKLKDSTKQNEINFNYEYSKDSNLYIKIVSGKIFLIKKSSSGNLYRGMKLKILNGDGGEKVTVIPTTYIEFNLNL